MKNKNIYIPGDLVMYDGKVRIIKEPRDKNHFDLREPETSLRVCYVPIDEISGVELTSDILEKNRWKPANVMPFTVYTKGLTLEYRLFLDKNIWRFKYEGKMLPIEIKYVHQLQHLLFGLGINSEMEV